MPTTRNSLISREGLGILKLVRDNTCEVAALEQLTSFAASACHFVFGGADGLLSAAAGFHSKNVPIAA